MCFIIKDDKIPTIINGLSKHIGGLNNIQFVSVILMAHGLAKLYIFLVNNIKHKITITYEGRAIGYLCIPKERL